MLSESPLNDESATASAKTVGRSRRWFRWLLVVLVIAVVAPVFLVGYRWQQQMAFIREIENRNGEIETQQRGPKWLREFVGDDRMRGFEQMTIISLDQTVDRELSLVSQRPSPQLLVLNAPRLSEAGVQEFGTLNDLEELGFWFWKEPRTPVLEQLTEFQSLRKLTFGQTDLTDRELEYLSELNSLESLSLQGTNINGAGLIHLSKLPRLNELYLEHCDINDDGLASLREFTDRIDFLNLAYNPITDRGLEHLQPLTKVRTLWLGGTNITDGGLVHLRGMSDLLVLDLSETGITDAGLSELSHFPSLIEVNLMETKVTPEGVRKLRAVLFPSCQVLYHQASP